MTDTSVKYYDSTMANAPLLTGTVGALIGVLDDCLINGFGAVAVDSLVVSSGVATATVSTGHGLSMHGLTGPVITLSGATTAALNGEWRLASVPNATSFTFAAPAISDQTAGGSISVRRAGAGWSKPYSGSNRAAYQPADGFSQCLLRVVDDDTLPTAAGRWAKVRGYESMSDIDTGINPFPSLVSVDGDGQQVTKSRLSTADAAPWWLVADAGILYFGTHWYAVAGYTSTFASHASFYVFGDTGSLRPGDAYCCMLAANRASNDALASYPGQYNYAYTTSYTTTDDGQRYARSHTQLVGAVRAGFTGGNRVIAAVGGSGFAYPYPVNNGLMLCPVVPNEAGLFRALAMPGFYAPMHNNALVDYSPIDDVPALPGRTLQCLPLAYGTSKGQGLWDITGPWVRG